MKPSLSDSAQRQVRVALWKHTLGCVVVGMIHATGIICTAAMIAWLMLEIGALP
jgi:hypothetical protein